jgi:hypothetical protein
VAVGAAPFEEMPSNREILRRVKALVPEAAQNEPDQHVVSKVILKQFTQPWGKKGELLLPASTSGIRTEDSPGRAGEIRQDPRLSPLCLKFGRGSLGRDRDPATRAAGSHQAG